MESVMNQPAPDWVRDCAKLPLAFAQVREDALIDLAVTSALGDRLNVAMIASGGCTSAALVSSNKVANLEMVDCNSAQLGLARLKLDLLQTCNPATRMQLLGHAAMPQEERKSALLEVFGRTGLAPDVFGPLDFVAEVGPDHSGRYERVFHALQLELAPRRAAIEQLLRRRHPQVQEQTLAPSGSLGAQFDGAFEKVMALPNLVALFGEGATRNRVMPFGQHFAWRTRHALSTLPAFNNPYVSQVLCGGFTGGVTFPWLKMPKAKKPATLAYTQAPMKEALVNHKGDLDFAHLSNILDWLSSEEAVETLEATRQALRPGGIVLIRQLNSSLDVRACGPGFTWNSEWSSKLHAEDRSYFYRDLHLGVKR
jgi:S-adenosylmethionine-diacylglycerol 3-amino-3-carboxypropyl transferase